MRIVKLSLIALLTLILVACSGNDNIEYEYSDYSYYKITSYDQQLNHPQNDYYIYYYYEGCSACFYVKNDVLSTISSLDEDYLLLFDLYAGVNLHTSGYLRDKEDGKFYTPTIVHVKDGEFIGKWVGIDEVLSILENLE